MRCLLVAVLLGVTCHISAQNTCSIPDAEKQDCGFKGKSEKTCLERGCCWVPCRGCNSRIPWCFYSQEMTTEDCDVSYEEKEDCGSYGIKKDECLERGCCWKPSKRPNDPWCFKSKAEPTTTTTTTTTTTEPGYEGQIRLVGGSSSYPGGEYGYIYYDEPIGYTGRVEIYHDGQWGTVCDDYFGAEDAQVVCRQLGWYGGRAIGEAYYGQGEEPTWLDDVACNGNEYALSDCSHNGWGYEDCGHSEDVSVECETMPPTTTPEPGYEGEIRLVGGSGSNTGRVEIYHDYRWGTVCDDNFGQVDSQVVCRQAGYYGGRAIGEAYYGEGDGPIWMDEVACSGDESALSECEHSGWGNEDCSHSEDASVACETEPPTQEPSEEPEVVTEAPEVVTEGDQSESSGSGMGRRAFSDDEDF